MEKSRPERTTYPGCRTKPAWLIATSTWSERKRVSIPGGRVSPGRFTAETEASSRSVRNPLRLHPMAAAHPAGPPPATITSKLVDLPAIGGPVTASDGCRRSEEHTSELQSLRHLV